MCESYLFQIVTNSASSHFFLVSFFQFYVLWYRSMIIFCLTNCIILSFKYFEKIVYLSIKRGFAECYINRLTFLLPHNTYLLNNYLVTYSPYFDAVVYSLQLTYIYWYRLFWFCILNGTWNIYARHCLKLR